jgi:hypothetical protein
VAAAIMANAVANDVLVIMASLCRSPASSVPAGSASKISLSNFYYCVERSRRQSGSMILSENRYPPRIKSGACFFGIML